jgi:glucose-1-phosphate cytidylyltransferase
MKTVILAGGFGSRISEESHLHPKPMIEIGGFPILWHIMKYYSYFGHNEFIICCGYKGYSIKEYFADYYLHRSDVTFDFTANNSMQVHNNVAEPWRVTLLDTGLNSQTGYRIRKVMDYVGDDPFFMTYGDGVATVDLDKLLEQHGASGKVVTMTAVKPTGRFGVLELDEVNLSVTAFHEKPVEDKSWVNAGFMVMNREVFGYIENDANCVFERRPLEKMAKGGKLGLYKHYGFWRLIRFLRGWALPKGGITSIPRVSV